MPTLNSSAANKETATSISATVATNSGDLIFVVVGGWNSGASNSVSDTIGNTYTKIFSSDVRNGNGAVYWNAWYAQSKGTNSANVVTFTTSTSISLFLGVADYIGMGGTTSLDASVSASSSSQEESCNTGTFSTTNADDLIVVGWGTASNVSGTGSLSGGGTVDLSAEDFIGIGHLVVTTVQSDTSFTGGTLSIVANMFALAAAFTYTIPPPTGSIPWTLPVPWRNTAH